MNTIGAFLLSLQVMESSGNYQLVNTLNYLGAYQFGEAALIDLGFVRSDADAYDNNYSGGWTGKHGVHSVSDFLTSRHAQDRAMDEWLRLMWHYIEELELDGYAGHQIGEVTLTPSGMLGATHLLGPYALAEFIASNGEADLRDPYGTSIQTYIVNLADYEIPFAPEAS